MSSEDSKPWYKRAEVIVPIIVAIIGLMGIIVPHFISQPQTPELSSEPQFITLQGKVADEAKMPVAGVTVSIDGISDITGDDGKYCLRDIPLGGGVKIIRVEQMKKEIYKNAVEIDEGKKIMVVDIPLTLATPTPAQVVTEDVVYDVDVWDTYGGEDTWDTNYGDVPDAWDTNYDDVPDMWDTNYDGNADMWDTNYDGNADLWDTNYDGIADMGDTNYDGNADVWDTNYDGVPDAFDMDGDGYIDVWL